MTPIVPIREPLDYEINRSSRRNSRKSENNSQNPKERKTSCCTFKNFQLNSWNPTLTTTFIVDCTGLRNSSDPGSLTLPFPRSTVTFISPVTLEELFQYKLVCESSSLPPCPSKPLSHRVRLPCLLNDVFGIPFSRTE